MNSNPEQFRPRSRTEMLFDFLQARFPTIVAALIGGGLLIIVGIDPEKPRRWWAKLGAFTMLAFAPLGWMFGNWLLGHLYDPNFQYLVDLDFPAFSPAGLSLHQLESFSLLARVLDLFFICSSFRYVTILRIVIGHRPTNCPCCSSPQT